MALSVPAVPSLNCSLSCSDSCVRRPSEADRAYGHNSGWPQSQISRSVSAKGEERKLRVWAASAALCVWCVFSNAMCLPSPGSKLA